MILDFKYYYVSKVRSALLYVTSPIQHVVNWPLKSYKSFTESVLSQTMLRRENLELRYKQVLLNGRLQKLLSLEDENTQLRKLLSYKKQSENSKFLLAELLIVKTDPYRQMIVLDRGIKDNIFVGQAVFDSNGVFGQVIDVGPFTSTVMLITDPKSAVPVKNTRTGERGILKGVNQTNSLSLINVARTSLVKPGDNLVTSGLGKRFPEGYPVGTISAVMSRENNEFIKVDVSPTAQLSKSRLMLLTWHNETDQKLLKELASIKHEGRR